MLTNLLERSQTSLLTPEQYQTYPLGALLPLRPKKEGRKKLMPHTTFCHTQETTMGTGSCRSKIRKLNQIVQVIPLVLDTQNLEKGTWVYCKEALPFQTLLVDSNSQQQGKMALAPNLVWYHLCRGESLAYAQTTGRTCTLVTVVIPKVGNWGTEGCK